MTSCVVYFLLFVLFVDLVCYVYLKLRCPPPCPPPVIKLPECVDLLRACPCVVPSNSTNFGPIFQQSNPSGENDLFVGCFGYSSINLNQSIISYFGKGPCVLPQANLDAIPYDLWIFDDKLGAVWGIQFAATSPSPNQYQINIEEGPFPICIPQTAK